MYNAFNSYRPYSFLVLCDISAYIIVFYCLFPEILKKLVAHHNYVETLNCIHVKVFENYANIIFLTVLFANFNVCHTFFYEYGPILYNIKYKIYT